MNIYKLKIENKENSSRVISILRKFNPAIPIREIRRRIKENEYVVEYDLNHWDITEEMAGTDRISRFTSLINSLEESGASIRIYDEDELIDEEIFKNRMEMLREIEQEVNEDMDREAEE